MRCQHCNGTEIQGLCKTCGVIGPIDSIVARAVAEKFHGFTLPPKSSHKTETTDFICAVANKLIDVANYARNVHGDDRELNNMLSQLTIMHGGLVGSALNDFSRKERVIAALKDQLADALRTTEARR